MDQPTLEYIIAISGTIIVLLFGVIAYFGKRLLVSFENLQKDVQGLRETYSSQNTDLSNFRTQCSAINQTTVKRLDSHARRLDDHSERITVIETKLK